MKCKKCDGELEITRTTIEQDYIELLLSCKENQDHKFLTFVDRTDLADYDE